MSDLVFRQVEVDGEIVDVRVEGPTIAEIAPSIDPGGLPVVEGGGGALIPGLHDHHIHLLATAAAASSVPVGPAQVYDRTGLAAALRSAALAMPPDGWVRAVGYHDSVAGPLDREALDAIVPDRPLRVQHRTGALWVLNSAAIASIELEAASDAPAERDSRGRATGRLFRADEWLRDRLPPRELPDLRSLGVRLAALGVTGVTDATPVRRMSGLEVLADAALPQRVVAMCDVELAGSSPPVGIEPGPVKIILDDDALPSLQDLAQQIDRAHQLGRRAAIHCVTRASLVLALAAWDEAGDAGGDRIEHGSVIPPELFDLIARIGLTVVTQPAFVTERGDEYLAEVEPDDLPHLYRCASLLEHGIPVAASSDGPYTTTDPWAAMRAAVRREAPNGSVVGPGERVSARRALELFLGSPEDPGGPPRAVAAGEPSDLCLLAVPLSAALERLSAADVVGTWRGGDRLDELGAGSRQE